MPLLNPPDILPEAMRFLLRTVLANRADRCPKAELLALVAPAGLTEAMRPLDSDKDDDPASENTATSGRLIAESSLTALASIGFVSIDGGDVMATEVALSHWRNASAISAASFSRVLRSRIWRLAATEATSDTNSRVGTLVNGLAVLFAVREPLSPLEFEAGAGRQFTDSQAQWFGTDKRDWPVTNIEQFRSFYRWAPYLGLAQPLTARSLIADASRALLEDLVDLPTQRLRAAEFVAHCAAVLPISDGGPHSLWKADDGQELSPGLSMSLRQLEAAGHLNLPPAESDTDSFVVGLGRAGEATRISHITWHVRTPAKERS